MVTILSGSALTVLSQMMCPRKFISGLKKFHLAALIVKPAAVDL